jgi:hypothetical protein
MTYFDQATISFPADIFTATTTVTMTATPPPHLTDPNFHPIRRALTFSAPATANDAFDVFYPDLGSFPQLEAVALNGSQVIATLPIIRQKGQVGIHVDPALIPPGTGSLQVTICLGEVSH